MPAASDVNDAIPPGRSRRAQPEPPAPAPRPPALALRPLRIEIAIVRPAPVFIAVPGGRRTRPLAPRRAQRFWPHFWLLMTTAGLGNALYALHVIAVNRRNGWQ